MYLNLHYLFNMIRNCMKYYFVAFLFFLLNYKISAHEPIYGHGPHVLFKGGLAPGFTLQSGLGFVQNEFNLEYGATANWTIGTDIPFSDKRGSYDFDGIRIKSKYRFYTLYSRGAMLQFAALSSYKFTKNSTGINVFNLGLTAGREAIDWYWFASAVYTGKVTNSILKPGNEINYDLTFGYRLNKPNYYKPDLVLFLEFIGKHQFTSKLNGNVIGQSGGNAWAVAPTLMFTYRNYALRAGVEFGIGESGYINRPETNFKVSIEMHI